MMIPRLWLAGLLCSCWIAGNLGGAEVRPQRTTVSARMDFHSFVNWDYRFRRKLNGWKATEAAIRKTLEEWAPGRTAHTLVENGTSQDFREFLHALPTREKCDLSIVYLASHQSPEGEWDFVQRRLESVDGIVSEAHVPRHPARLVIVDACYAAALHRQPAWNSEMQSLGLFAASATEETPELDFRNPHPIDLRRRYPAASHWLNEHLGKSWDGKLSFLGFVWVQTFVSSKDVPADMKGWSDFLRRCVETADEFRRVAGKRLASGVTFSDAVPSVPPVRGQRSR